MRKYGVIIGVMVAIAIVVITTLAFAGNMMNIKTNKTVYLMDPYWWVYSAAYCNPPGPAGNAGYWPIGGYPRDVNFTVRVYDAIGVGPGDVPGGLSYQVLDGASIVKNGTVNPTADTGIYSGTFRLRDADLGGSDFSGQEPRELTLKVASANGSVAQQKIVVGRWGCDRCHIASMYGEENGFAPLAREIYPWVAPTGGFYGPHGWGGILGRTGSAANYFTDQVLKDSTRAHTPGDILANHEMTIHKQCGNIACSPCHQGTAGVNLRAPWGAGYRDCWIDQAKSRAVECTFCHGIEGGYTPRDPDTGGLVRWASVGGFITMGHGHENVPTPDPTAIPTVVGAPWLSRQTCSNPGCHGHVNASAEKRAIDNAKPDCRVCHGIHSTAALP